MSERPKKSTIWKLISGCEGFAISSLWQINSSQNSQKKFMCVFFLCINTMLKCLTRVPILYAKRMKNLKKLFFSFSWNGSQVFNWLGFGPEKWKRLLTTTEKKVVKQKSVSRFAGSAVQIHNDLSDLTKIKHARNHDEKKKLFPIELITAAEEKNPEKIVHKQLLYFSC